MRTTAMVTLDGRVLLRSGQTIIELAEPNDTENLIRLLQDAGGQQRAILGIGSTDDQDSQQKRSAANVGENDVQRQRSVFDVLLEDYCERYELSDAERYLAEDLDELATRIAIRDPSFLSCFELAKAHVRSWVTGEGRGVEIAAPNFPE